MKKTNYIVCVLCMAACMATSLAAENVSVTADGKSSSKKEVVVEEAAKPWSVNLSSGFDSLYIFRGVNVIPGHPLYWVQPTLSYNITPNDSLSVGAWYAVGLHNTKYQELDIITSYTHTMGNWALSAGYIFYYVPMTDGVYPYYSHELNAGLAYTFDFKWIKIRPNSTYYFNIGPNNHHNGYSPNAGSYLQNRVDFSIPVYKDIIEIDPWVALNINFCYNANSSGTYFNGINNFEYGVKVPWKVQSWMTVSAYVASTNQWANLPNTAMHQVYFGGAVSLTY